MKSVQGSTKRIERFSKFVHFFIALILGGFLSALGEKILDDLEALFQSPVYDNYIEANQIKDINKQIDSLKDKITIFNEKINQLKIGYNITNDNYLTEKDNYDDWIKTRRAIDNPEKDDELMKRLYKLEELNKALISWQKIIGNYQDSISQLEVQQRVLNNKIEELNQSTDLKYQKDLRAYENKIFLIRLIFAIPILAIGIFLFIKYRDVKYRAFIWGVIFFSVYIFFIGLVPYLPSYGGYVRSIVGIIVTIIIGYYLIKQISLYYERKSAELLSSREERIKKIKYDTAVKSYQLHTCPSCERDFQLIKDTDNKPNYCVHCGLLLFENCPHCQHRNFSHFIYCSACGKKLKPD